MPLRAHDIDSAAVHKAIQLLITQLINIKDEKGTYLLHLPTGGPPIDTKSWSPTTPSWEWTHGIALYGIWQYHLLTSSDPEPSPYLSIIESWFAPRFAAGGCPKNVNTMSVFLTLACVYEATGNKAYEPWLDAWGEWAYHDLPRTRYGGMQHVTYLGANEGQLWDDTLMMSVLPLAKIGKVLGRAHYVREAVRQFLVHVKYLFDPVTGLFFHGWQFEEGKGAEGHHFARARWARGNSWLAIVIPEFLELVGLEGDDPVRRHLLDTLEAQLAAIKRYQTASGLWCTLLDQPEEDGSYVEASATAGFAYGILKAGRKRFVNVNGGKDGDRLMDTAVRAIKGVTGNISEEGELLNVSFGTGMGDTLQFYKDIPKTSMPYGQAMAIMALTEFLRVYI
jgi:unsaturated rhamnogalacturonyl hydrolase